jgi:cyclic pyranopterin monophosphate synthase
VAHRTQKLTHTDARGKASMVDVGDKPITQRTAAAQARVVMSREAFDAVLKNALAKGDALATARLAGILAAKRCDELIPLCHALPLDGVDVRFTPQHDPPGFTLLATVRTNARTGVEMEALAAVTLAGLTLIDMAKSIDRGMRLTDVRVTMKAGGKSGNWRENAQGQLVKQRAAR